MSRLSQIPVFNLFGETDDFPDVVHYETISARAHLHDWQIAAHRHSEMVQIFQMERGQAEVQIDGREYRLTDGEFLYIPAQAVHGFAFRKGAEGGVFSFPLALLSAMPSGSDELYRTLRRAIHAPATQGLTALLSVLIAAFRGSGTFRASQLATTGKAILVVVAEAASQAEEESDSPLQRRMGDFDRLLRQHLSADWGAREFAQSLGITAGHLNRICRGATGASASAYIEAARMREAGRLLAFTQLSIAEVGYRLGYEDPPYFSRRFRQVVGETPSTYRARFV